MAGVMLETPSRVWRRIEAGEENDMPSLPSLPTFDDSAAGLSSSQRRSDSIHQSDESDQIHPSDESLPFHSTPTAAFSHHTASTIRPPGSSGSTARFAHSVAISRSSKSGSSNSQSRLGGSGSASRQFQLQSFEVSEIRPFDNDSGSSDEGEYDVAPSMELANSRASVQGRYTQAGPSFSDEDLDLTEALEDISRSNSPFRENELNHALSPPKNGKYHDFSASLRSEPKVRIHSDLCVLY